MYLYASLPFYPTLFLIEIFQLKNLYQFLKKNTPTNQKQICTKARLRFS